MIIKKEISNDKLYLLCRLIAERIKEMESPSIKLKLKHYKTLIEILLKNDIDKLVNRIENY